MKKTKMLLSAVFLMSLSFCILAGPNTVAQVSVGGNGILWQPNISYSGLVLSVSYPDGSVFTKTFSSGVTPYFDPADNTGKPLIDGAYTYELRVIPTSSKKSPRLGDEANKQQLTLQNPENPRPQTQTGYFHVRGGSILNPSTTMQEGISQPLDIVHSDDVIIDGSLCVGNDCYSGLAFGFDTIALMENNLRIFFDDTSTIQNYPRNDWRIVINDSTDGGGNYFAIEDATDVSKIMVLEAGAPSNSLYVDSHGDVGINTSTPYYELHIVDGDSPAIRLDQDGSYGWTPQKWDLCGNESNFFIRDATHASKLPFRIIPDAPTDSLFINSNGNIGMGTGSPDATLEVETTGEAAKIWVNRTDGATAEFLAKSAAVSFGSKTNHEVQITSNSTTKMVIQTDGDVGIGNTSPGYLLTVGTSGAYCDGGAWVDGSSKEFKENINELHLEEAAKTLESLKPVRYNYKTNKQEEYLGFIAEDVPELVATKDRKGMAAMDVVAVLTKVLQEQQKTMKEQQEIIIDLKQRVSELENKKD